jgi:hypothetical protein
LAAGRIALFMGWLLLMIPRLHLGWIGGLIVSVKVRIGPWIFLLNHFQFLLFVSGIIESLKQHGCNNLDGARCFDFVPACIDRRGDQTFHLIGYSVPTIDIPIGIMSRMGGFEHASTPQKKLKLPKPQKAPINPQALLEFSKGDELPASCN